MTSLEEQQLLAGSPKANAHTNVAVAGARYHSTTPTPTLVIATRCTGAVDGALSTLHVLRFPPYYSWAHFLAALAVLSHRYRQYQHMMATATLKMGEGNVRLLVVWDSPSELGKLRISQSSQKQWFLNL